MFSKSVIAVHGQSLAKLYLWQTGLTIVAFFVDNSIADFNSVFQRTVFFLNGIFFENTCLQLVLISAL